MSGLRDLCCNHAKIPGRVADALPAFNLIPCPARLSLPPIWTDPRPTPGVGSYKKKTFFPAPRPYEARTSHGQPGHTSPFLRDHIPLASIIPGRDSQCRRSVAPAGKAVYAGGKHHGRSSMPKLRLLLCCLALLFLAAPAMAEEDELAPGFDRCMEQSGGVTTEMLGCLQQAYEYWDARLNTNYKKARQACKSSSDPKACSDKLLKGQRAWVQYKEAFTDLVQLPNEDGSMARLNSMSFLTGETRKQALLLGQIAGE